ncbi:MAG TPA: hypothetical protein VNN80_23435 [Polyangiaceae bacterium]|nr:hypothetical protein [Polyangiaceae bacterium]
MSGWRHACRARVPLGLGLLAALAGCDGQVIEPGVGAGGRAARAVAGAAGGAAAVRGTAAAAGQPELPAARADAGPLPEPVVDAGDPGVTPERQYCDAPAKVFAESCGNGSCHTNRGATIGDFAVGQAEAERYVGRSSVRNAECGLVIDPVEPQNSLILTKVNGEYPAELPCGGPMPVGSFLVTDEQIDCISDWVEQFRR